MAHTTAPHADIPRSWSDLPLDLAAQVLGRLPRPPRHLDRVRFSGVGRQWRAAARENPTLPRHFPWLALPDRSFFSLPAWAIQPLPPFHLKHHRQLPLAQSSCGEWIVFERNDGKLTLMSPFSAATMVLPLHDLYAPDRPFKAVRGMRRPAIRKLVVVSAKDKLVAATVVDETRLGKVVFKLALCRPGAFRWTLATGAHAVLNILRDIVLYKGQLYAVDIHWALFSLSVSVSGEPVVSRVDRVIGPAVQRLGMFKAALACYLLESDGRLLMIYRRRESRLRGVALPEKASKFMVFVANFERSRWKRAQCNTQLLEAVPEDRMLFLGPWCCRSVPISDNHHKRYIDLGGSSIVFFSDHGHGDDYHRKRVPFYCSIYNIRKARSQLLLQASVRPLKGFQTTWLFPPASKA